MINITPSAPVGIPRERVRRGETIQAPAVTQQQRMVPAEAE